MMIKKNINHNDDDYGDLLGETYEPELGMPSVGERRFFRDEDGSIAEYEFTEEGQWIS